MIFSAVATGDWGRRPQQAVQAHPARCLQFLYRIRYNSYKQRLYVHLGNREYRRLLLGVPQTPSFGKKERALL